MVVLVLTKTTIQDPTQDQDQALQEQDQISQDQDQDLQKVALNGLKTKTWS